MTIVRCKFLKCLHNNSALDSKDEYCSLEEVVIVDGKCNSRANRSSHFSTDPARMVQGGNIPDVPSWVPANI